MSDIQFEEFVKEIPNWNETLKKALPKADWLDGNGTFRTEKIFKQNNATYTGLVYQDDKINSIPTFRLEEFWKGNRGFKGDSMEEIMDRLSFELEIFYGKYLNERPFEAQGLFTFDNVKNGIVAHLCETEKNLDMLSTRPSLPLEGTDLSMTFSVSVDRLYETDEGLKVFGTERKPIPNGACIPITKDFLKHWGVTEEKLLECAVEQAEKRSKAKSLYDSELLPLIGNAFLENSFEEMKRERPAYVITAEAGKEFFDELESFSASGASVLLAKKFLENFRREHGDFILTPSSVYELIARPLYNGHEVMSLMGVQKEREILRGMNEEEAELGCRENILSDSVYLFTEEGLCIATDENMKKAINRIVDSIRETGEYRIVSGEMDLDDVLEEGR